MKTEDYKIINIKTPNPALRTTVLACLLAFAIGTSTMQAQLLYSSSPGMAVSMDNVGAKCPAAFTDANGDFLNGSKNSQPP